MSPDIRHRPPEASTNAQLVDSVIKALQRCFAQLDDTSLMAWRRSAIAFPHYIEHELPSRMTGMRADERPLLLRHLVVD